MNKSLEKLRVVELEGLMCKEKIPYPVSRLNKTSLIEHIKNVELTVIIERRVNLIFW